MTSQLTVLTDDKLKLLRDTICKGATPQEFELFVHACNRTGLDPFMKQIHAVKRWNDKLGREEMSIQTGIDGFRLIAERTGMYSPGREPTCAYDKDNKLVSATAYIKKQTKDGTWHEVAATAHWAEYAPAPYKNGKMNPFWQRMPHVMLQKCSEALALRKAFPADLSGIYTTEEMAQAGSDDTIPAQIEPDAISVQEETPTPIPEDPAKRDSIMKELNNIIFGFSKEESERFCKGLDKNFIVLDTATLANLEFALAGARSIKGIKS